MFAYLDEDRQLELMAFFHEEQSKEEQVSFLASLKEERNKFAKTTGVLPSGSIMNMHLALVYRYLTIKRKSLHLLQFLG